MGYGVLAKVDNPVKYARILCDSWARCTGFTFLGNEFWFKTEHNTVYGAGEHRRSTEEDSELSYLWQTYLKCPEYTGESRRFLSGKRSVAKKKEQMKQALKQLDKTS